MLYLNDVVLGILKPEREDTFGWKGDEPESPGETVDPAYPTGRLHDKLSIGFNISNYQTVTEALRDLFDTDPCGVYYLHETDPGFAVYGMQSGVWVTNVVIRSKCTLINRGEATLECTVTTDNEESEYIPP